MRVLFNLSVLNKADNDLVDALTCCSLRLISCDAEPQQPLACLMDDKDDSERFLLIVAIVMNFLL